MKGRKMKRVAIITSSDMGYQGKREDLSGPAIKKSQKEKAIR